MKNNDRTSSLAMLVGLKQYLVTNGGVSLLLVIAAKGCLRQKVRRPLRPGGMRGPPGASSLPRVPLGYPWVPISWRVAAVVSSGPFLFAYLRILQLTAPSTLPSSDYDEVPENFCKINSTPFLLFLISNLIFDAHLDRSKGGLFGWEGNKGTSFTLTSSVSQHRTFFNGSVTGK